MLPNRFFPRLIFPKGEQSKFINSLCEKNSFNTKQLAEMIGIPPRTLSDWKREKYYISEFGLNLICNRFHIPIPNNVNKLREDWEKERLKANRKGGLARFRIYGSPATIEGCRKGGSNALRILRERGIIPECKYYSFPSNKSFELAEFMGIMLGDGGITNAQATVTLNTVADSKYIKFVAELGKNLFGEEPSISPRTDCKATNLRFNGIKMIEFLVKNGLKVGNKVKQQVGVPNWIYQVKDYKIACLRGLMDTDGGISICTHKRGLKKYRYCRPCFANKSRPLLEFVSNTLKEFGFHPCVAGYRIWLYNRFEVGKYFDVIGSDNYRLFRFKEDIPNGSGDGSLNHIAQAIDRFDSCILR